MTSEECKNLPVGTILVDSDFGLVKLISSQVDDFNAVEVFIISRGEKSLTWPEDLSIPTSLLLELL